MLTRRILPAIAAILLVVYLGVLGAQFLLREREFTRTAPLQSAAAEAYPSSVSSEPEPLLTSAPAEAQEPVSAEPLDVVQEYGFELSPLTVRQGSFAVLTVQNATRRQAATDLRVTSSLNVTPVWGEVEGGVCAFFPVRFDCPVGEYLVTAEGGGHSEEFLLRVVEGGFPVQYMEIDESTASETIHSNTANEEFMAKAQPIKSVSVREILWEGPFILPVEGGWRSTEFGSIRYVNGVYTEQHGGIDIAVPRGTPVHAANRGVVVFAEPLQLTGNTVAIEHGLGLKTWYYHMDSIAVSAGDTVEQGDVIGAVGSTGFSTGPHMHFGATMGKTWIDPDLLLEEANLPAAEKAA